MCSGRNIAPQIAISRDLEVASRMMLMLGVLAAQVPPLGAAGGGMGGGGLGGAQVWRVGYVAVARRREIAVQIAIPCDLEVARRVLLMLGVLPAQVPPLGAAGVALGGGSIGGAQVCSRR